MTVVKRTYELPDATVAAFEQVVGPGRRSATVAALIQDWLEAAARRRLRDEIVAGLEDMTDEYLAVEREYHSLEEEVERDAERTTAGAGRQGASRPGRGVRAGR